MILYSDSTKGFYIQGKHRTIPGDAVEITDDEHQTLLTEQSQGREIFLHGNGRPATRPRNKSRPQQVDELRATVSDHVEAFARSEGFESTLDAVSYADEPAEPNRQSKAIAIRLWRSQCWAVFDAEIVGQLPSAEDLIAALPAAPSV